MTQSSPCNSKQLLPTLRMGITSAPPSSRSVDRTALDAIAFGFSKECTAPLCNSLVRADSLRETFSQQVCDPVVLSQRTKKLCSAMLEGLSEFCHTSSFVTHTNISLFTPLIGDLLSVMKIVEISLCQSSPDLSSIIHILLQVFCHDQTMVELLLSHHFVRSCPEESVLGDRVMGIDGRDLHRLCSAWDDR